MSCDILIAAFQLAEDKRPLSYHLFAIIELPTVDWGWTDDFARFNEVCDGTEVEIIAMRGERAVCNRAFMNYMRAHPEARQAYEQGKVAHAYSKRAYMRWKDNFIADMLDSL